MRIHLQKAGREARAELVEHLRAEAVLVLHTELVWKDLELRPWWSRSYEYSSSMFLKRMCFEDYAMFSAD